MKRALMILVIVSFVSSLLWSLPKIVYAGECDDKGGVCKAICESDETSLGTLDCNPYNLEIGVVCCKKGHSGCKGDFFPCDNHEECCSGKCGQYATDRNFVCVPAFALTPTPILVGGIQPTECDTPAGPKTGIQTALGCIPTKNTTQFVGWLLGAAVGIGGGIAFLLIIFGAVKILTSSGNPESVKAGQELITSALMGLLFIIFSLFLLQLIGVKILQIPGFGTP
ncbi:MAG: hypothetical protein ACPLXP_00310 [Microgenomates group bacterium]